MGDRGLKLGSPPHSWGPGRKVREFGSNNEETISLAAVEILLSQGANPNVKGEYGMTPLHCAASSGWTLTAITLIDAGAKVYTGPQICPPICYVVDGSGSNHPMAVLLRAHLGPEGWKKVEADHAARSGAKERH